MSETYELLAKQAQSLFENESHQVANSAQLAALLFYSLDDISWAGFYFLEGDELVMGPFQGKIACVRLPLSKGVCAHAVSQRKTVLVADVDAFEGHIACDSNTRSEIVVPIFKDKKCMGVLDLDSATKSRFSQEDVAGLETICNIYSDSTCFNFS